MSRAFYNTSRAIASVNKALDSLDIHDDINELRYPFREAGEIPRTLGDTIRDGFSKNNFKLMAELQRDAERQAGLTPFLDPDEGGALASLNNTPYQYDALPEGSLQTRILTIRGAKDMTTIECTLKAVDLERVMV
ncbi:hypothetical protein OQA88_10651 [Cercophora sp. LCS_1]